MDVQSTFLNAPLQEEISQGIIENKETQEIQLNKVLCGLKKASLVWYKHLSKWLITSSFECSITDPCVFWRKNKFPIWIYIHVDDLSIFGPNIEDFKQEIKKYFDMKDLSKDHSLLGIKINHLSDGFSLDQEHYIRWLAEKYKIKDLIPSNTPLKPHLQLSTSSNKEHEQFNKFHLSRFLKKPGLQHWNAYADLGNNPVDQRSVSGFTISVNSHLISWKSKKKTDHISFNNRSQYKALRDAAKETTWLINIINKIQLTSSSLEPLLLNDNKGATDLALCDANHSGFKTKHMDIKFHFIRELPKNGNMLLKHVPTTSMNADFLTKSLGKTILIRSLQFHNLLKKNVCSLHVPRKGDVKM
ncbi:hypothetical protein O181_042866 [Austropuccinia psidii MF-1]|uniref:Reverse transcriptase Ty1/copia-type domain-containing protein n=1 Tax=Austropuccinia psidii MF-1 TaxID=1389203 RepID=A0A9Q3DME9_9BASI|nr:hypothetical protein [Austropuccinia psidii MF-1]